MSNLLGTVDPTRPTSLCSAAELTAREGVNLQKGMTYRNDSRHSVFLVLPHEDVFCDEWDEGSSTYVFIGHDSVTTDAGRGQDQRAMYESGRLSENGKFLKTADKGEAIEIQVYEKIDAGVWFDKGLFILKGAAESKYEGRRVYKFFLEPSNIGYFTLDRLHGERMLSATTKADVWKRDNGRCSECGNEHGLRFVPQNGGIVLLCPPHRGETGGLLG